ncbi:hypothetical protein V8C86DRAFT_3023810, partial [Haematococcus lacustris]
MPPSPYPAPSPHPTIPHMPARSAAVHAESRVAAAAVGARAAAVEVEAAAAVEARAGAAASPPCQGQSCWAPLCPAAVGPAAVREVCNWALRCVPGSNHLAPGSHQQPPASTPSGASPTPTAASEQGPGVCWHCPGAGAAPVVVAATLSLQPPYPPPTAGPQQGTSSLGHPGPGSASGTAAALLPAHSLPHSLTRSHSHSRHSALSLPLLCSTSAAAGVRSRQLVSTGSTTTDQDALAWLAAVGVAPDADILTPVGGLHFTTTASIAPEDAQATATGSECSQGHSPSRSHSSPLDTRQRENSVEWQPGQAAPDRLPSSLTTAWQKTWQESPDSSKADRTACRRVGAGGEAGTMELTGSGHLASSCCNSRDPRHSAGADLAAARTTTTTTTTTATLDYLSGCNCPSSGCSSFPGREAGGGQQPRVDAWPAGPHTTVPGPACLVAAQLGGRGGWASEEGGEKVVVEEEEEEGQEGQEDVLAMAGQWVDPAETLKLARAAAAAAGNPHPSSNQDKCPTALPFSVTHPWHRTPQPRHAGQVVSWLGRLASCLCPRHLLSPLQLAATQAQPACQVLLLHGACSGSSSVQHAGQGRGTTPAALTSFLCDLGCWCQWWGALAGGQRQASHTPHGWGLIGEKLGSNPASLGPPCSWAPEQLGPLNWGGSLTCDPDMGMQARMLSMALTVLQYSAVLASSVLPAGPAEQTAELSSLQGVGQQPGAAAGLASTHCWEHGWPTPLTQPSPGLHLSAPSTAAAACSPAGCRGGPLHLTPHQLLPIAAELLPAAPTITWGSQGSQSSSRAAGVSHQQASAASQPGSSRVTSWSPTTPHDGIFLLPEQASQAAMASPLPPPPQGSTLHIAGQGIGMGSCTPPVVTLPPHSSAKGLFRRRRRALAAAGGQQEQQHASARFAVGPQACCFAVVAGLVAWLAAHPHAVNATGLVWLLLGLALGTLFHSASLLRGHHSCGCITGQASPRSRHWAS